MLAQVDRKSPVRTGHIHGERGKGITRDERGSAMVLALILLISLTVLGSVFVSLSTTDNQIARNQSLAEKALYLTEVGWRSAYREFALHNFMSLTHNHDGSWPYTVYPMTTSELDSLVWDNSEENGLRDERNNGDWVWEWEPGDDHPSFSGTNLPESFRYRLYPASGSPTDQEFILEVEATVGTAHREIQVRGYTEPAFTYTYFADGDLGEFTRGANQTVVGRVHANGDICMAPWGTSLQLDITSITATGDMYRWRDLWGRDARADGVVLIKDGDGSYQDMVWGTEGNAFDSFHDDWANCDTSDATEGALERWDGVVRDGALGAPPIAPPPLQSLEPGGYYEAEAGLKLYAGDLQRDANGSDVSGLVGSAVGEVDFYNPSTGLDVTVQELDVAELQSRGLFPANGVIYCDSPLRIVNADSLAGPVSIVASNSIYTLGDFNTQAKKSAAIMTTGRIWHLSSRWSDAPGKTHADPSARQATDGITMINAAMLDGVPVVNEANYADLDGDGEPDGYPGTCWANADYLLETWGNARTLKKRGSIVHLGAANMSEDPLNNILDEPGEIGWQRYSAYGPPRRDYAYDPMFMGVGGQPPLAPRVGHVTLWQEVTP